MGMPKNATEEQINSTLPTWARIRWDSLTVSETELIYSLFVGHPHSVRVLVADVVIQKGPEAYLAVRALTAPIAAWKRGGVLPEGARIDISDRFRAVQAL